MAGSGTISVNQTPKYGDKSKLAAASKTLTKTPMTGNLTPAPTAGRPSSAGTSASPAGVAAIQTQPESRVDPEHETAFKELAQAFRTHQFWQNVLAQYPSEWSQMYAKEAKRNYEQVQQRTRSATPFFE